MATGRVPRGHGRRQDRCEALRGEAGAASTHRSWRMVQGACSPAGVRVLRRNSRRTNGGQRHRTHGRTSSPSDDPAMASLPRRGKLTVGCLRQACGLWTTQECCPQPTGPTAAADNLNDLEISSVRATPGSPLKGSPQGRPAWALLPLPPSLRGVRTAVHKRHCRLDEDLTCLVNAIAAGRYGWRMPASSTNESGA